MSTAYIFATVIAIVVALFAGNLLNSKKKKHG